METLKLRAQNVSDDSVYAAAARTSDLSLPVQVSNEIVLLLEPTIDQSDLSRLLTDYSLEVISTIPQIGVIVVSVADEKLDAEKTEFTSPEELANSETNSLIAQLQGDDRIVSATPNSILSSFSIRSAIVATGVPPSAGQSSEIVDWGMRDTKIHESWNKTINPIDVGAIDVGFSRHTDLPLRRALNQTVSADDHGTHVAGIMCAKHNGVAVKGAIKNCTVHYATGSSVLAKVSPVEWGNDEVSQFVAWSAVFSEFVGTVLDFMEENPDVKTINLSLGYNWMPNFGEDPRNNINLRNLVRGNARIFMSMLTYAVERDIILVSAAGNDSTNLSQPLDAEWASPFNGGSKLMERKFGWTNGIVVEAHDIFGKRADFSNTGGHISCPGVDVISTIDSPPKNIGMMSGTSMAAPYCTSGLAVLRQRYPNYSLRRIIRCAIDNPTKIENRVPKFDLSQAIQRCEAPDRNASLKQKISHIETWAEDSMQPSEYTPASGTASENKCSKQEAVIPITQVFDQGDGGGPELGNDESKEAVYSFLDQTVENGCHEQIVLITPVSFYDFDSDRYNFVAAVWNEINRSDVRNRVTILHFPTDSEGELANLESVLQDNVVLASGYSDIPNVIDRLSQ